MKSEDPGAVADSLSSAPHIPKVVVHFSGYKPPFDPVPIIERMLQSVPPKYLVGLSEVVLTNTAGLSREMRRSVTKARKRKVRVAESLGLYRQAWQGKPAWIQIFVDNTLEGYTGRLQERIFFAHESMLARVLFHEIGHHIHYTARPEHREKEDVADVWMVMLEKNYLRKRHPILRTILTLTRPLTRPLILRFHRKTAVRMLSRGAISRAEFDEATKDNPPAN
jgi:hypothetical protein